MCPTPIGRVHTRVYGLIPGACLAALVAVFAGNIDWLVLVGVFLLMGVALDSAVYPWILKYQPPWMTGILALAELLLLLVLASVVELEITIVGGIILYVAVFALFIATKIAVMPLVSLTYLESAGEIRRAQWSVPPSQASLPVLANVDPSQPVGPVVREASGAHAVPVERKPPPSAVREIPAELRGAGR
ncbi:MAG: hypothetical protein ACR2NA_04010 [Solirubrobacterales bacterium]